MLRRWISRGLAFLTMGLVGAAVSPGCADPDSMLFIRQVMAVSPPDCAARAGISEPALFNGTLDVLATSEYKAILLVANQLVSRGSSDRLRTETSRVTLTRAEVTVENAAGTQIDAFTVPISGFSDQSTGTEPGLGLASVTLVSSRAVASALNGAKGTDTRRVISKVRVFGNTLGGSEVQSNEFQFVVFVCAGCLVNFPSGVDSDPTDDVLDCLGVGADAVDTKEVACFVGQDSSIDCRLLCARGQCPQVSLSSDSE